LQRVANLPLRGIAHPQGSFDVSTTYFMASPSPASPASPGFSSLRLAQFEFEHAFAK
jgi:hypothetical protein